eukprot:CAMPEP_0171932794 /NCGR_PEP_ID=MMETSP0993-20121228/30695_1 /TAXON_ID=483369 /ORGANISM="non described non described, Strain CCMP2098" /LENGTH=101 /DNA_ID=CAMNT_0012573171 /DNA_START=15 /DNA_END=318 /DNA_ORIENTATION=-
MTIVVVGVKRGKAEETAEEKVSCGKAAGARPLPWAAETAEAALKAREGKGYGATSNAHSAVSRALQLKPQWLQALATAIKFRSTTKGPYGSSFFVVVVVVV